MIKAPSPTQLRPPSGRTSGINRKAIVIGGVVVLMIGGFAVSQMYLIDEERIKPQETGLHISTNDEDFLKNAPKDYSGMYRPEPMAPAAQHLAQGVAMPVAPPPPPPDAPIKPCARPSLSYQAGALSGIYQESMEYRQCRNLLAYEIAMREYTKKYPQGQNSGSPFGGGGQMVTASTGRTMAASSSPRASAASSSRSPSSGVAPAVVSQANATETAAPSGNKLYHESSLEELPVDECVIPAGSDIPAALAKDVNVSQPGTARIVVTRDVLDYTGSQIAIPAGSQIVVTYAGDLQYGQERASIGSTILTLPNGLTMSLDGLQGYDPTGQTGLPIDVNNHNLALFGTAILGGIIDAIPAMAGLRANVEFGGGVNDVTSTGRQIVERELNRPPTAEPIPSGTEILISLDKHIVLGECYQ